MTSYSTSEVTGGQKIMMYFTLTLSKADLVKLLKPVRLLEATKATEACPQMTLEVGMWSKEKNKLKKFESSWESIPGPIAWQNGRENQIFKKKCIFQNTKSISEQARVRGFSMTQCPHNVSTSIRGSFRNRNLQTDPKVAWKQAIFGLPLLVKLKFSCLRPYFGMIFWNL